MRGSNEYIVGHDSNLRLDRLNIRIIVRILSVTPMDLVALPVHHALCVSPTAQAPTPARRLRLIRCPAPLILAVFIAVLIF